MYVNIKVTLPYAKNIVVYIHVLVTNSMVNFTETLTELGTGLGNFLTAIVDPVTSFILVLGIIGGVLSIFYGISYVIKSSISKGARR